MAEGKYLIVKLENPALCYGCKSASVAVVELNTGEKREMLRCKREIGNCDNHLVELGAQGVRQIDDGELPKY